MEEYNKPSVIVVAGPTATGKTNLSLQLAERYNGEIISADSMQIYKGLDIATAKASKAEQLAVPHHLIDFVEPSNKYSVAEFVKDANNAVLDINKRGRTPIICGGTGLYISSLVNGISFTDEKTNTELRERLQNALLEKGAEAMLEIVRVNDPEYAQKLHLNDHKRIIRAIEIFETTGMNMSEHLALSVPAEKPYNATIIGLNFSSRKTLYDKINLRVEEMVNNNVELEAKMVYNNKDSWQTAAQAIGYKEYFPYFEGLVTFKEATENMKQSSRRYAKRQISWFGRVEDLDWVDPETTSFEKICNQIRIDKG